MDEIKIYNLEVFCNHGVFPEENTLGQKFMVSAVLGLDTRKAGVSDDLTKSIHYGEVCQYITQLMKSHTYKLIETVAESLAENLLLETTCLESVQIEVKKPWAPIGLPLETVSVCIERSWHTAYIALGSNLGDKEAYLHQAIKALNVRKESKVVTVSEFIRTEPYGYEEQEEFLNGVLALRTLMTPEELLECLQAIEADAGRERKIHWGPRTLDLDILLYDSLMVDTPSLTIPHADMQNRSFVLEPMVQIAGYVRHPVYHKTMRELLEELKDRTVIIK